MNILVLGAGGMMGHMACRVLSKKHEVWGASRSAHSDRAELARFLPRDRWVGNVDLFRFQSIVSAVRQVRPEVVFNCIGIVKQLATAKDPMISIEANSLFPHRLNELCAVAGAKLLHMSTDCVFSGNRGMYTLDDNPDPVDLYGRSKLLGEVSDHNALTMRTSIVGRQIEGCTGLFEWFLNQKEGRVRGYSRAIYTGLTTMTLARIVEQVLESHFNLSGVWQIASEPINKHELLQQLAERLSLDIEVQPDRDFYCDRSLDGSRFVEATGIEVPAWSQMLDDFARDNSTYQQSGTPG